MMQRWGRLADRVGTLKVMKLTSPVIGLLPVLWMVSRNPFYLIFVQVISGVAWAGFNLCASNFIFDAVSPQKRTRCIAYFNVLNGTALFLGAMIGGFLSDKLPPLWGYQLFSLFLISSSLRLLVALALPHKLKEVRPVEKLNNYQLFSLLIGIRPLLVADRKAVRY